MNVSVFGGSAPRPDEPAYADAQRLGRLLAERGHQVLTGGYIGTMEAVSRGAAEAGGHVVGVTCSEIERWRPVGANPWVREEHKAATLVERLQILIGRSDASLALPGGPGTLTEVALTWNLMIVESRQPAPLILIGKGWLKVMKTFLEELGPYVPVEQRRLLTYAQTVEAAVKILDIQEGTRGDSNE